MGRHKKKQEQSLIKWRRKEVAERWLGNGENAKTIAEDLKVSLSLIYEDMDYIETHADDLMKSYLVKTVPLIITKSIYQIDAANKTCRDVAKSTQDDKLKITAALAVARTARDIVEIIAGNKGVVDKALELDESLKTVLSEQLVGDNDNNVILFGNSSQEQETREGSSEDSQEVF